MKPAAPVTSSFISALELVQSVRIDREWTESMPLPASDSAYAGFSAMSAPRGAHILTVHLAFGIPGMKPIDSHKDLAVWHKSIALASRVYALTRELSGPDGADLRTRMRNAALAIASHIAEGASRGNRSEFLKLLQLARGALSELETQMTIAVQQESLPDGAASLDCIADVRTSLNALMSRLAAGPLEAHARACVPFAAAPRPSASR